jgi:ankyrin repeat protein
MSGIVYLGYREVSVNRLVIICMLFYGIKAYAMEVDLKKFHNDVRANNIEAVTALLKKAPDAVNLTNDKQETALHIAALESEGEMVDLLIKRNAAVNAKDIYGETPLFKAALIGREYNVRALIHAGAHVNAIRENQAPEPKDRYQYTAVQLACALGHVKVVEMLLEAGADSAIKGDLKTAQELAQQCPYNRKALLKIKALHKK